MSSKSPRPFTLLTAVLLIIFVAWPFSAHADAKGRKRRSASRSKSSKRSSARRSQRRSNKVAADRDVAVIPEHYPIAPDEIEVFENGSDSAIEMSRYKNPSPPRFQKSQDSTNADPNLITKRKGLKIDESRALQIQQALKQRGFYTGEMTGVYDHATIEAMRRFQTQEKIPATGYPTAHALKRLGLAN
ncbi:MAG TPA: peptidoglycan-binding domain-containing protein [Blastocatellia bacterium]